MSQVLISFSTWLHALATVIFIGHFVLVALIYLPALSKNGNGSVLSEISKKSRSWMYASLIVLLVTGTYLTVIDPNYLGIGKFNNFWTILMLVKHILIMGMIALGFWYNAILRVGPMMSSNHGAEQAILRFRSYVNIMAILGVLALLLTALSQVR